LDRAFDLSIWIYIHQTGLWGIDVLELGPESSITCWALVKLRVTMSAKVGKKLMKFVSHSSVEVSLSFGTRGEVGQFKEATIQGQQLISVFLALIAAVSHGPEPACLMMC